MNNDPDQPTSITNIAKGEQRFGNIALIGAPNAGKSTLTNALVGQKVSIVSKKPQTTRFRITAIVEKGNSQFGLIDTPGVFIAQKEFDRAMVSSAWHALERVEGVVLMVAADMGINATVEHIIKRLRQQKKPVIIAINKIDRVEKKTLLRLVDALPTDESINRVMLISALKKDGVDDLLAAMLALLPVGPWGYDSEMASTLPDRLFAAEILREQLFRQLHQELPYRLMVETEQWGVQKNEHTKKEVLHIHQTIHIEKESHRAMILGRGGQTLKTIASHARGEMEKIFESKVFLKIFVRVTPGWQRRHDLTDVFSYYG